MEAAKVTSKGQITIPKKVRMRLNIREGDSVIFSVEKDHAVLKPLRKKSLSNFYGIFPSTRKYPGSEAVRKEIRKKLSKKLLELKEE